MQFVKPAPFREAIDKLDSRTIVRSGLNSEQWAQVPVALRERAFFSSQVESARFLQRARDSIADFMQGKRETLADGATRLKTGSRADFIKQLQDFAIAEGLGPLDPKDTGTIKDIRSERRLGLIFDTQTRQSDDFGYWQQGQDPAVLEEFPAQRFIRETPAKKPRDIHVHHEGEVRLKSDIAFWTGLNKDFGVPWGPWGWGCGHAVEDVDREEAQRLGLIKPDESAKPAQVDFNERLQASVQHLDADLQKQLKEAFGDQIKIERDAVWWKGDRKGKSLAVPKAPRQRRPAQPDPEPTPSMPRLAPFPSSLDDVEEVRQLGGSTGATLVREKKSGSMFVLKRGANAAHVQEESVADDLYRALGVSVPESKILEHGGRPAKLARFIEGQPIKQALAKASKEERKAILSKVQEGFTADALLGNWDVAGLDLDNILVDKAGTPWRVDTGGSLRFRAMGKAKVGSDWDGHATEIWSLRDSASNPQTASLFEGLDIYSIARQITKIDDAKLATVAPGELKPVLESRLANLKQISSKALEFESAKFSAPHADQITKQMMHLRKANVMNGIADELKQAHPGDVRPIDKDGNPFDFLRTPKTKAKVDPSDAFYDDILGAVKTINHHHKQGDVSYNPAKISKALSHKGALQQMLAAGTDAQKEMAANYLGFLNQVETAQGSITTQIPPFSKFQKTGPQSAARRGSAVSQLAEYMNANGGDWKIIEEWAEAQASSSSNREPMALKYWLMKRLNAVEETEFHNPPSAAAYNALKKKHGDKLDASFEIYHAFIQEVLGRVQFPGNDRDAKLVRILRTESTTKAVPFKKGASGEYKRGVNESGSVFAPALSGTRTVTIVPHARITGLYFLERTPGTGKSFFYGDTENELTYIGHGYKALNLGVQGDVNLSPGTDHTKWEQP